MAKSQKFNPPEGLVLNYDNLYVFPADGEGYMAMYGDTIYTFKDSEVEEICDKFNSVGCTSFQLSAEDLLKIVKKLDCVK
jgi:hypothetical protein